MSKRPAIVFDPSKYDHLPFGLQPPQDGSSGYRGGAAELIKLMPLMHLPRGLIPKRGLHVQPPRFHYGWAHTDEELFQMAVRGGFLRTYHLRRGQTITAAHMNDMATVEELARVVREKLGVTSCKPILWIAWSPKSNTCISLTDNYVRGNRTPPAEDVEAIRKFLGVEEAPSWHLDSRGCDRWGVRQYK